MGNVLGGRNFVAAHEADPAHLIAAESGDPDDLEDKLGHGSHVTGAIAGNGLIKGVGPDLGIRVYRVFDASGFAEARPSTPTTGLSGRGFGLPPGVHLVRLEGVAGARFLRLGSRTL
ncbi:MAG: S8 family serine peptidase [Nitrospinae bacterium]|nr:S8 family serine peptidase [Nitrospinota bacterium]